MRIVLDVNVWISGLLWAGVPGDIFDLAEEQRITIFASKPIWQDFKIYMLQLSSNQTIGSWF
ncbi:putative toxin-antitoxin system toxin component, PIN family [Nostoc sp. C117]|uniref:putative toxin-antitoxin system toxin component, PIN family n=1 Tax=Nostoc sp. C117 TaxID=3349875 RepID=UPI00370D50B5